MKLHKHRNKYRVQVKEGSKWKWKSLSSDYEESLRLAEELFSVNGQLFRHAIARYKKEILPNKAPKTIRPQISQIERLNKVFGDIHLKDIDQPMAIEYMDRRGKPVANREIALFRHILTKCVHWGWLKYNPLMRLQYRIKEPGRDRVVSNKEIRYVMKQAKPRERYLIWLIYLTGLRREDALAINDLSFKEGFLHVTERKTNKRVRIKITRALEKLRDKLSPAYFTQVSESGIDTAWQRLRQKLKPYDLFQLKDLRAAHAGEVEDLGGDATRQLGHSSRALTQKHYLRNGRIISPSR